jgi:hypothetical protein
MLKEEQLQLKEFFVEGRHQEESCVLLHISDPSTSEERKRGHFFVLYEVEGADQTYVTKIQTLIEHLRDTYYKDQSLTNEKALETVLGILNNQTAYLLESKKMIHCVIGAITREELVFSFSGQPHVLLFYKNKQENFDSMDLTQNNSEVENAIDEASSAILFSQIVQGKLGSTDILVLASHQILSHITPAYLKFTITTKPLDESCQILENILIKTRSNNSFGGLLIKNLPVLNTNEPLKSNAVLNRGSEKSLQSFFATEKNTASTLSSSLGHHLAHRLGSRIKSSFSTSSEATGSQSGFRSNNQLNPDQNYKTTNHTTPIKPPLVKILSTLKKFFLTTISMIFSLILSLLSLLKGIFFILTNIGNQRKITLENWKKQLHAYKENVKQLPIITKVLIFTCLIFLLVIISSTLFTHSHNQKNQAEKLYQAQLTQINSALNDVESTSMYDTNEASEKIEKTRELLKNLSCNSATQKKSCDKLNTQLQTMFLKINKTTSVSPTILLSWQTNNGSILDGLVKIKNKLLGFSHNSNTIYVYDLISGTQTPESPTTTLDGFIDASIPEENETALLLSKNNIIYSYNPSLNTFSKLTISYPDEKVNITNIVAYNHRLYSLDASHNQIYRHDQIADGFGLGKKWIKNPIPDLKQSISLTIDGDLFVLQASGATTKLSQGNSQPFTMQTINPPLSTGNKIWTYNDLKFIYVLDQNQKRLIIYDKQGNLIQQITSKEFIKPSDMVIDETNKAALILDSNQVFKFNLPI